MFPTSTTENGTNHLIYEIQNLLKELEIPERLSDLGVTGDKIEAMSIDAMKSGNILVNPRKSCKEDVIQLYYDAL